MNQNHPNSNFIPSGPPLPWFIAKPEKVNIGAGPFEWTISASEYAILSDSAYQHSFTISTDPWYATEDLPSSEMPFMNETYWVRDRRPPLSCSETSNWTYHGHHVGTADLDTIPGLPVPAVLLDALQETMAYPMVFQIGSGLGEFAFISEFTFNGGLFDANSSGIVNNMQRLVWAAYVFNRNIFTDTTRVPASLKLGVENIFLNSDGTLREGSGDFVVTILAVTTISFNGLVGIPLFLFGLLILRVGLDFLPRKRKDNGDPEDSWWATFNQRLDRQYIKETLAWVPGERDMDGGTDAILRDVRESSMLPEGNSSL
ncbi:hypothetical protein RUND412_006093 [Rhizina undulata]